MSRGYFLLLLLFCVFISPLNSQTNTESENTIKKSEAEKWREDLRFMSEEMVKRHRNLFHTMKREQFEEAVKKLDARIPTLERNRIIVEMARIVAMVKDGHTNIAPTRDARIGFRTLPIKLYFFKEGIFIRSATREHTDLAGAKVIKIGDTKIEDAYDAASEIVGKDNDMDAKFFAPFLLTMPEVLHALNIITDMEAAKFVVEISGQQKTITLTPFGVAEMMPPDSDISWLAKENWIDVRENKTPLWLKDPQNKFWFEYLTDSKTVYVQFNQVGNKENETVEAFAERLQTFIASNSVERLILDLRLNRGGNGGLNRSMLRAIIKSDKIDKQGKFFAIIGRSTWSAAQFLVNDLERYTNVIFVGEPSGGKVNHYGDSTRIILPSSGITVRVSTLWWQEDERDKREWTSPKVSAELSLEDYRKGNDPAFDAVMNYQSLTDKLAAALKTNDTALLIKQYRAFKADPKNVSTNTENEIMSLAFQMINAKRIETGIELFKLNTESYMNSAIAFRVLGDAYALNGNRESAIKSYEKSLELNPKNEIVRVQLERLKLQK